MSAPELDGQARGFVAGERVRVAPITGTVIPDPMLGGDGQGLALEVGDGGRVWLGPRALEAVTVARLAPVQWPPRPGDLWRDRTGEPWFALQCTPAGDVRMYGISTLQPPQQPNAWLATYGPAELIYRRINVTVIDDDGAHDEPLFPKEACVDMDDPDDPNYLDGPDHLDDPDDAAEVADGDVGLGPDVDVEMITPEQIAVGDVLRLPLGAARMTVTVTDVDHGPAETTVYFDNVDGAEREYVLHGGAVARVRPAGGEAR